MDGTRGFFTGKLNLLLKETVRAWSAMTLYQRFEQSIALALTLVISFIIVGSLFHLVWDVARLFITKVNPLDHKVFQEIFGEILTVLIAMEFQHSIVRMIERTHGIIQVKTVLLIAILALARKFIIIELHSVEPLTLISMGVSVLTLGLVYWLMRERDDRYRLMRSKFPSKKERRERNSLHRPLSGERNKESAGAF